MEIIPYQFLCKLIQKVSRNLSGGFKLIGIVDEIVNSGSSDYYSLIEEDIYDISICAPSDCDRSVGFFLT